MNSYLQIDRRCVISFLLTFAFVTFQGCKNTQTPGATLNTYIKSSYDTSQTIPVFIASNRAGLGEGCDNASFTVDLHDKLRFVKCSVSVPKKHTIGSLDRKKSSITGSDSYFKIEGMKAYNEKQFYSQAKSDHVLVFVHGFNVEFEEALLRVSQIAYDVKFQGTVVLFTWPAGSKSGFLDRLLMNKTYQVNQNNASRSTQEFQKFIEQLSSHNKNIQVIVHSMGHQVVLPALIDLHKEGNDKILDQVVLNAPDFSTSEFLKQVKHIQGIANRVTLYCSPGDNALLASVQFNKNHRIGLCANIKGVDIINVNEIDSPVLGLGGLGHGYYSGRAIITDLFQTLLGVDVRKRLFIRSGNKDGFSHYYLRK